MVGFAVNADLVNTAGRSTGEDEEGATTVVTLAVANPNSGLQTTDGEAITLRGERHRGMARDAGGTRCLRSRSTP